MLQLGNQYRPSYRPHILHVKGENVYIITGHQHRLAQPKKKLRKILFSFFVLFFKNFICVSGRNPNNWQNKKKNQKIGNGNTIIIIIISFLSIIHSCVLCCSSCGLGKIPGDFGVGGGGPRPAAYYSYKHSWKKTARGYLGDDMNEKWLRNNTTHAVCRLERNRKKLWNKVKAIWEFIRLFFRRCRRPGGCTIKIIITIKKGTFKMRR